MSALVAVSQITQKPTRILKQARSLVASNTLSPQLISELAGSLGSFEIENGDLKEGRRLFAKALIDPTENVLAQVHWVAQQNDRVFDVSSTWKAAPLAYELQAFEAYVQGEPDVALENAMRWHVDEPFSSRPVILASFLASLQERHADFIVPCQDALRSNPDDEQLRNNLIYCLIASGKVNEAEVHLRNVLRKSPNIQARANAYANAGYLYLKVGQEAEGRLLYEKAIEMFQKHGESERAALALAFYSRALRDTGFTAWEAPIEQIKAAYSKLNSPAVAMITKSISKNANSGLSIPLREKEALMNTWRYDKETNTLIIRTPKLLRLQ